MSANIQETAENQAVLTNEHYEYRFVCADTVDRLLSRNNNIKCISCDLDTEGNLVRKINCQFVNTKKPISIRIYFNEGNIFVMAELSGSHEPNTEELVILKQMMYEISNITKYITVGENKFKIPFLFFCDNENETIDFDDVFKNRSRKESPAVWTMWRNKLKDLDVPFNVLTQCRIRQYYFSRKYPTDWEDRFNKYMEKKMKTITGNAVIDEAPEMVEEITQETTDTITIPVVNVNDSWDVVKDALTKAGFSQEMLSQIKLKKAFIKRQYPEDANQRFNELLNQMMA